MNPVPRKTGKRRELQVHAPFEEPASPALEHKTRSRAHGGRVSQVSFLGKNCRFSTERFPARAGITSKRKFKKNNFRTKTVSRSGTAGLIAKVGADGKEENRKMGTKMGKWEKWNDGNRRRRPAGPSRDPSTPLGMTVTRLIPDWDAPNRRCARRSEKDRLGEGEGGGVA